MIIIGLMYDMHFAPVAQLDRALGYGPGGSGFKSAGAPKLIEF